MSLVSVANFTAPFKNRVHLITIILVTIVFATLRLSGASVEVHSTSDAKRSSSVPADTSRTGANDTLAPFGRQEAAQPSQQHYEGEDFLRAARAQRAAQAKHNDASLSINQNSQGDLIEDVMRPPAAPVARNKAAEQSQAERDKLQGGSLSDIEKQLGLK